METLEKSRVCRLCGKQSGISIDIFDKNENHVRKINAILPILVHEMDLLPKQMCHRCSYKLEEFYNFYVECAKTDTDLKSQLSWMRKETLEEKIVTPMVKMNRFKIKTEPLENNIDPNGVVDHISESSLLFPGSILQSFDLNSGPVLSCAKCQCVSNKSIKVNKKSPKQIKTIPKTQSENQPHSSNALSNISDKVELNKPNSVDKNLNLCSDLRENDSFKETNAKDVTVVNLHCVKTNDNNDTEILKSEKLNRALRPRKGSVDYIGPKRKGIATNLRAKFKSKLEMLNPTLVNPVNIKLSQSNIVHPTPIIKLEKLDDSMRSLRVNKNLEEFNKRIKEFQVKKKLNKEEKILQRAEKLGKKILQNEENIIRKSLQKEDNSNRKSLQKEDSFRRKSLQKEGSQSRKSLQKGENSNRKSVKIEENINKYSLQNEENQTKNNSQKEENQNEICLQGEHTQERKSFLAEESQGMRNLRIEDNENNTQNVNIGTNKIENIIVKELKIKQEDKTVESYNCVNEELIQLEDEKSHHADIPKDKNLSKPTDKLPFCAIVKLEKDYTCNVDYPRIKIKRQLAVANSSKSENGTLEIPVKRKKGIESVNTKLFSETNGIALAKSIKSKEKRLKGSIKSAKMSKKNDKQLNFVNTKQTVLKENPPVVLPHSDLKHYCEECDTCFKNKELYKLHPCYQK